ncbi:unnamed protein product, partial [Allacma fusca]
MFKQPMPIIIEKIPGSRVQMRVCLMGEKSVTNDLVEDTRLDVGFEERFKKMNTTEQGIFCDGHLGNTYIH